MFNIFTLHLEAARRALIVSSGSALRSLQC